MTTRPKPTLFDLFEQLYDTFDDWAVERREARIRPPRPAGIILRVSPEVHLSSEVTPMATTVFRVDADFEPVPTGVPPERVARQILRLVLDGQDLDEVEVPLGTPSFEIPTRFDVDEQLTVHARYQNAAGLDGPEFTVALEPFAVPADGGDGGDGGGDVPAEPEPPPAHPGVRLRVTPEAAPDEAPAPGDITAGATG